MVEIPKFLSTPVRVAFVGGLLAGCSLAESRGNIPFESIVTSTRAASETPVPSPSPSETPTITPIPPTLTPTSIPDFYQYEGISFRPGEDPLNLEIALPGSETFIISTNPVLNNIDNCDRNPGGSFRPRERTSCEFVHVTHGEDYDISHYVHTGVNPDTDLPHPAEFVRRYLEDNEYGARVLAEEREIRMAEFEQGLATLSRGELSVEGLEVLDVVRIPPTNVPEFTRSFENTIYVAATIDPGVARYIDNGRQEIFIIFCGRITTDEHDVPPGAELSPARWSRYIIVIGREDETSQISPFLAFIPGALIGEKGFFVWINKKPSKKKGVA